MKQTKRKPKRKVHTVRLTGIICGIVILALAAFGIIKLAQKIEYDRHQEELRTLLAETVDQYEAEIQTLNNVTKPDDLDQTVFDTIKNSALESIDISSLQKMELLEELNDEDIESAVSTIEKNKNEETIYFTENIASYPQYWLEYYLNDTDRYKFVKAYTDQADYQTAPETLTESLTAVPHLLQWDLRWGWLPYGDSYVSIAGCAPTCLSMVISYLNQDPSITPAVVKTWADENGYYVIGAGSAHTLLSDAAVNYGVNVYGLTVDADSVIQALQSGQYLILNMVPGQFTSVGHFIVVSGYDEATGQIQVLDPNSNERTRLWDINEVLAETAAIWAYYK